MRAARLLVLSAALLGATPLSAMEVVPTPPFNAIELHGGGHLVIRHGAVQQVRLLEGSSAITRFHVEPDRKLVIEACARDCPQHMDLEIEITTPELAGVSIEGGGAIETAGGFPDQRSLSVAIEGGGRIDTSSIDARSASAAVEGGGHVKVRARETLNAVVEGGGHIEYWGNAAVTRVIDGGGSISKGG